MKQPKSALFRGVCTALATPFRDGGIDWDALAELIELQIAGGVAAICICGTTGEAATLSDGERLQLVARAGEMIGGRCDYVVGVGSPSTARSVSYARFAAANGADALLVVTPYYNKGTHDGITRHFHTVADSTDLPVILYNVPSRTGVDLTVAHLTEIAAHPNIRGLKEAGDSLAKLPDFMAALGGKMQLYAGNDAAILPTLALGGSGVVSVLSNLLPAEVTDICQLFFDGKTEEARRLSLALLPLTHLLFRETNPAPLKCALELLGLARGEIRLPLSEVSPVLREELREALGL